jgi:arylformamidase
MELYDITPAITPRLAVWPGDTPPTREILLHLEWGNAVTLSTLRTTVHLGAHADAPSHYGVGGDTIERRPLGRYIGPCRVIEALAKPRTCLSSAVVPLQPGSERLLFRTGTYRDPGQFHEEFAALSAELIATAHERGVHLVGIDTPSVDLFDSKDLPAHKACLARDVAILEGLALEGVPEGLYELIALPLKLVGFDASPVRAILRR